MKQFTSPRRIASSLNASRRTCNGWTEFRAESNERFERLTGHAARVASGAERPSILLDIRNVGPRHDGTSRAVWAASGAARSRHHGTSPYGRTRRR